MKTIKGLVIFAGFLVALCLVIVGRALLASSLVTDLCALAVGVGLFYVLYRFVNSN